MKALLITDTHWLWYSAGRWGNRNGFRKPRVDYMALRNYIAKFLISRFGRLYDLECKAFVANQEHRDMSKFLDLLKGFGYYIKLCPDPATEIINDLKHNPWDLIVLAVGSIEVVSATKKIQKNGRKVLLASFELEEHTNEIDGLVRLDSKVLYEAFKVNYNK